MAQVGGEHDLTGREGILARSLAGLDLRFLDADDAVVGGADEPQRVAVSDGDPGAVDLEHVHHLVRQPVEHLPDVVSPGDGGRVVGKGVTQGMLVDHGRVSW